MLSLYLMYFQKLNFNSFPNQKSNFALNSETTYSASDASEIEFLMSRSPESLLQLLQQFLKNPNQVHQIHALIITKAYFLCKSQWKNTLLYNSLIRAHLCFGQHRKSLILFTDMLAHETHPNSYTFASIIKSLSRSSSFYLGPPIHGQAIKRGVLGDPFVGTSLVSFYSECGVLCSARKVFEEMPERDVVACNAMIYAFCENDDVGSAVSLFKSMSDRDVVTWTSVINGLGMNSRFFKAVGVFKRMVDYAVKPNEATYVSLIGCCVGLDGFGGFELGKQVHGYVIRNESTLTVNTATALIDLYGKSGLVKSAVNVFDQMPTKEACAWNAMISAYASNGEEHNALSLFHRMKTEGFKPNEVTFVAILVACARGNLVEVGLKLFWSMSAVFGVVPMMEHYGCVVDMLGRAGLFVEAVKFVKNMPFEPDGSVLGALLGACKNHGESELGNEVGRKLIDLQRNYSGRYVALSSINASVQQWDRAADLRRVMTNIGVEKIPAYSLVA